MPAITLTVNGSARTLDIRDPEKPLLYAIRNDANGPSEVYRIPLVAPRDARLVGHVGPAGASDAAAATELCVPAPA